MTLALSRTLQGKSGFIISWNSKIQLPVFRRLSSALFSLQKSVGVDEARATCCCARQFWICIRVGSVPRQVVTKNQTRVLEFGGYVRMGVRDDTIALHNMHRER